MTRIPTPEKRCVRISEKPVIFVLDTVICLCYNIACGQSADGEWCNGSTYDSDSYCLGSNPSSPAFLFLAPLSRGLGRGPLKAETRVRIPSELLFYVLANQRVCGFFYTRKQALYPNRASVRFSARFLCQDPSLFTLRSHNFIERPPLFVYNAPDGVFSFCPIVRNGGIPE